MELIKIYQGNVISARELHEFLEVKTVFADWIKRMLDYGFEENKEFFSNLGKTSQKGGRPQKEYFLTIGTAKEISMLQRNEKGRKARKYFIQCEEKLVQLAQNKRIEAFLKLKATKDKLREWVLSCGLDESKYIIIDKVGNITLFGEYVPDNELGLLGTKGRDFATEVTNELAQKHEIKDFEQLKKTNINNHSQIKDMLQESGIDATKLERENPIKGLDEE
ncbi:MAG: antA/AntB antirepressor family protein [Bacteroidota bacterium]